MLIVQSVDNRISHQEKEQTRCFEYAGRGDEVTEEEATRQLAPGSQLSFWIGRISSVKEREGISLSLQ